MAIYLKQGRKKKKSLFSLPLMIHILGFTNLALLLMTYDAAVNSSPCYQDRSVSALFNKARVVVTFCLSDLYIFLLPREHFGVMLSLPGITPEQSPTICSASGFELAPRWLGGRTKKYHQAPITPL